MRGMVLLAAFLVAGCGDDSVTWSDLEGAWRFRASEGTALEVFLESGLDGPPRFATIPGGPGDQLLFREPTDSAPVQPLATLGFNLDAEHRSLDYVISFGAAVVSARIQRVGDDQMIIDYTGTPRWQGFGSGERVTYTRAPDMKVEVMGLRTSVQKRP